MKKTVFTGAGVAIVTPFNDDFSVNFDKLGELIDFQINNGTDAIVICGTTGEASTLTDAEHKACIEFAVKKTAGRVPVIAGTGSNDTDYSIELARFAKKVGADAQLSVTPYYNKTTQKGLIKHFTATADAAQLPMILYNVPSRTGMTILPETYKALSEHENIVAVKEASGNLASVIKTRLLCGNALDIYSGDDTVITPMLSVGAKGVISVLSDIMPRQTHDICALWFEGRTAESAALQIELTDLIETLFIETNPIPVKAAMNMMGFDVGPCRLPLCEPDEANAEKLRNVLKKHNLIK